VGTQAFHHCLAQLSQLSPQQKSMLHRALQSPPATAVLECLPPLQSCLHCQTNGKQLALWGWSRGVRRYRCRIR
jgi:hypothetical protein